MSLESDIKLLGTVSMLSVFTEDKLRLLAFSAESRDFRDGQRLYSAGDRADCAHVVSSGEVALFAPGDAETAADGTTTITLRQQMSGPRGTIVHSLTFARVERAADLLALIAQVQRSAA